MLVLILSQLSDTLWVRVFPRPGEQRAFSSVVEETGVVLVGYTTQMGDRDGYIVAIDTAGNIVWETVVRRAGSDEVLRDIVRVPGGYFAVGWEGTPGARNIFAVRFDTLGSVLWDTTYGSGDEEGLYGITYDPHRDLLWGAGFYRPDGDSTYGGYVVSIDPSGALTPAFRIDTAIFLLDTIPNVLATCYNVSVGPDGTLAIDCKANRAYAGLDFAPYTCFTDSGATTIDSCLPLVYWTWDPGSYAYGFSALTVFRDPPMTFTGSTMINEFLAPNITGLAIWSLSGVEPTPTHWRPATPDTMWETFPVWGDSVGDSLFVWMAVSRDLHDYSGRPFYDPSDTTAPFPEPGDMDDARIVLFLAEDDGWDFGFYRYWVYDFPNTDVGVSAKVIPGDSTDYLIAGYTNSLSSDLDIFVMRVRPERLGVAERPVPVARDGRRRAIYDPAGRLVGHDIPPRVRGVFFVVEGRQVRRVIVR